jgi:hypothetical protein
MKLLMNCINCKKYEWQLFGDMIVVARPAAGLHEVLLFIV